MPILFCTVILFLFLKIYFIVKILLHFFIFYDRIYNERLFFAEGVVLITKHIKSDDENGILLAGETIKNGGLVAFPTETVYGLGASGFDENAVKSIFKAKGRPSDNPLILHIAFLEQAEEIAFLNDNAVSLARHFWPGPLTVVLPKKKAVPYCVTGGLETVAVRMPSNETARKLIIAANVPIAAPSANISGKPSPTTAEDVAYDMDGKIPVIIDGGPCQIGIESTVVDLTGKVPTVLRPGGITLDMLQEVLKDCVMDKGLLEPLKADETPKCPGMKYKHYAPKAEVIVFENGTESKIDEYLEKNSDKKLAVYCKNGRKYKCENIKYWGDNAADMAKNLFTDLRGFDKEGTEIILCEAPEMSQLGQSVRNRLYKSAGYNVIKK